MTRNLAHRESGFVLLYVVVTITLVAAITLALIGQGAIGTNIASGELQRDQLRYVAEAGMTHAQLQLSPSSTCDSYTNIATTSFATGSYTATVTPTSGSPVSIAATGTLASGAQRSLSRSDFKVLDANTTQTISLQPGTEGDDAEIWDQEPNNNYGDSGETWVSSASSDTTRSLLRFNVDAIPDGVTVLEATLSLLRKSGSGADQPVSAHRISNQWSEDSVSWNRREAGTNWDTAGGDFDNMAVATTPVGPLDQRYEWNITPLVAGWVDGSYPNYGVALIAAIVGMPGERFYTSDESNLDRRPSLSVTYACECGLPCADDTNTFYLSTDGEADLGGLNFLDKDLAEYDRAGDIGTLFLDSAAAGMDKKIDALHVLENGHLIFSVDADTTFGGLAFKKEDLVEYDPLAGTATMFLEAEVHFQSKQDVVSVHMLANGNIVLSTNGGATLGGLDFSDKDIVEYNRDTGQASIFFDGDATTLSAKIFAVHVLDNGHIVMAADGDTTLGGLSFGPDQLIDYDPVADTATLFFDGEILFSSTGEKVTAVHVGAGSGEIEEYYAGRNILFVVGDAASLTSEELDHQALIEFWGHSVEIIDDDAGQAEFRAAVLRNDVAFTTNDIESTSLGTKLVDASIGVVTSEVNLSDEFGLSSGIGWGSGTSLTIDDNADYITSPFPLGPLTILSTSESLAHVTSTLSPDLGQLASTSSGFGLVTLATGAAMVGGGAAAGPRVQLPWGGTGFDPNKLTDDGVTILRRALEWAAADILHVSTDSDAILGGLSFQDTDLARYNTVTDVASLFLDSAAVGQTKKVDALHVLKNGHLILSVDGDTTFAGLTFKSEDLVEYDPVADTATMFLEAEVHFQSKQNVVSVHVLPSGNIVLSTAGSATLGGLDFSDKDLVEYDRDTRQASIFFDGDATTLSKNIFGVHIKDNGHFVLAVEGDTTLGGLSVGPDQLIDYDPVTDTATLFFDGSALFTETSEKITALHVGAGRGLAGTSYLDEFNNIAFDGNNGSLLWTNDWQQLGESDGPGSGRVRILAAATQCVSGNCLRIGGDEVSLSGRGASREANLDEFISAELTFTIADSGSGGSVLLEISSDGGTNWTTLRTFAMGGSIPSTPALQYFDISAFIASDTQIRFVGSGTPDDAAYLYIDDVRIKGNSGGGSPAAAAYRDDFNSRTYSGNDGTMTWVTDWLEIGEGNGPTSGDEQVLSDSGFDYVLRVRDNDNGGEGVQREADLSPCSAANLVFDYRRKSFDGSGDYVTVDVSADGGGAWSELDRLSGPADESTYQPTSYDISGHMSANTRIRFLTSSTLGGSDELFVDNVEIACQ